MSLCIFPKQGQTHFFSELITYSSPLLNRDVYKRQEGDHVRARVVAVSINEREPKESKIGLTMRQTALGKLQWLEEANKKKQLHEVLNEGTA